MVASPKPRAGYADVLAAPERLVAEVLFGVLHTHPRPAGPHTRAASVLGVDLGGPFDRGRGGPGGWILLDEPELHLGEDIVVPDLGGWRRERMPEVSSDPYFTLAPDWVCEILSPSTGALDRGDKMHVYARERVGHVWLLDPIARTLEVFRLQSKRKRALPGSWTLVDVWHDDASVRAEPFEAVALALGSLWTARKRAARVRRPAKRRR